jgi:hypothetical protein
MNIANTFRQIEKTPSRNQKQEIFTKLLNEISNHSKLEYNRLRRQKMQFNEVRTHKFETNDFD